RRQKEPVSEVVRELGRLESQLARNPNDHDQACVGKSSALLGVDAHNASKKGNAKPGHAKERHGEGNGKDYGGLSTPERLILLLQEFVPRALLIELGLDRHHSHMQTDQDPHSDTSHRPRNGPSSTRQDPSSTRKDPSSTRKDPCSSPPVSVWHQRAMQLLSQVLIEWEQGGMVGTRAREKKTGEGPGSGSHVG
ncbi:unnamed protein product, partial [Discosporangium mesarthrocarpum]